MKKIILFSLTTIICSTVNTKVNAMQWQTIASLNNRLHHPGFKVILSENASWQQFHAKQNDIVSLWNIGTSITQRLEQKPSNCLSELLTTTTKMYANAIIQQEELAPRHYTRAENQKEYQIFINDLRNYVTSNTKQE